MQEFAVLLSVNLAIAIGSVVVLWLISIVIRDVSIIDMFFAVILMVMAGASFLLGNGAYQRKMLVLSLIGLWGIRITIHLVRRNWGHGEDPRYTKLRSWVKDDRSFYWLSLRQVFLLQGIVLWFTSLPFQFTMAHTQPAGLGVLGLAGTGLFLVGFIFETVADIQLTRFRSNPANKGMVLNTGLWRYSRHPNYFGELCVWWGIFLIACDNGLAWFTIIGPVTYSYLVINVTGQRTLDKKLAREKPGYREYMESTSGLVPWVPTRKGRPV